MKIALITLHTPTATNYRGASALPYHIIKFRQEDIQIDIWSFNNNNCNNSQIKQSESDLGAEIHIIPSSRKIKWLTPAIVRLFLPYPFQYYITIPENSIEEIKDFLGNDKNNGVWIYGEELSRHISKFQEYKNVITTPDCEAMYYYRMLGESGVPTAWKNIMRYSIMYHRYSKMASEFPNSNHIKYHLVGKEDTLFLKKLNPSINAYFINHPHYDISKHLFIKENNELRRLRLLIAGRYDIYMSKAVDQAILGMISVKDKIKDKYHITFLGKNWENSAKQLADLGFDVEVKGYVEDYVAEVSSHDIQLTPISVGTGTKGKVLDAFANGLMVIGTLRALENIAVESGVSSVQYETQEELASWLINLSNNPKKVYDIAKAGYEAVINYHSREKVSKEFFKLFE